MTRRTSHEIEDEAGNCTPVGSTPFVYRVVVEPDQDRYYAAVPALPGCYSWGYTWEEAFKNLKEALEVWLEVKREEGEPIPVEDPEIIRQAALTVGVVA